MVDSEDITLEKIKTQELFLEINNLSNTFIQPSYKIQLFMILLPNLHKSKPWILIKYLSPNIKTFVLFATKIITMFQLAFVDSIFLTNLNQNLDLELLPSINILKPPLIFLNILATVVEVIVILTVDLLVTLDIDLALTRARILVLDTMINLTLITIRLNTTVIDLEMTNSITKTPTNHTLLLHVHFIILSLLVVHLNIILVLVNVPQVIVTPPLKDTISLLPSFQTT